jgi:mannose-6-phosphate isomerase-like protein (cupin superfamily)
MTRREPFPGATVTAMKLDHARRREAPDTLAPDGSEIRLLVEHGTGSMCEVRLPPGGVSIPVRHRTVQEIWYFLEGDGEVWRELPGGEAGTVRVSPGSALTIPLGCRFQFRSAGPGDLRFLCMTTPPWPGDEEAIVEPDAGRWPVPHGAAGSAIPNHGELPAAPHPAGDI